jgi:hypothetical protein
MTFERKSSFIMFNLLYVNSTSYWDYYLGGIL